MKDQSPRLVYQEQIKKHGAFLTSLLKKRARLGWMRFFVFVLTLIVAYNVFVNAGLFGLIPAVVGIGRLLCLVSMDVNNSRKIQNTKTLISVNEEEIKVLDHAFHHRYDGNAFAPQLHDYANDLDLFGKASIFQWMNRCFTEQGKNLLAKNMLHPLAKKQVEQRHEAVKELAPMAGWRQQLQSFAEQTAITKRTEERTLNWLNAEEKHFSGRHWKIIVTIYSVITLGSALAAIFDYIPAGIFSFLFAVYFSVATILSRNTVKPYIELSGIVKEIDALQQLLAWIEDQRFQSDLLNSIQQEARQGNTTASVQIRGLKSILDRFDLRLNIAGLLFFNSFLLWDVRQMMALNEWRKKNKNLVGRWFEMVAEAEVLNSLATLHFNQPGWTFPKFEEQDFVFEGRDIGHPLIRETSRVNNNFGLNGNPKIGLITGSNMAGKSTFLRSIGVNTVLAQMGAPVCAQSLHLTPVRLMSSMRIADNLAENTSTFYAELKKLKTIIEAVNRHEKVFILLDEILRGTNSLDRHTGSAALIAQLIKENAVAVIATHDVELARLQDQYPESIENYHFDVQVEGEELYFDYKLKDNVCTSLNASILMKKIGIEL